MEYIIQNMFSHLVERKSGTLVAEKAARRVQMTTGNTARDDIKIKKCTPF